jgi:hypothetical protein
MPAVRHALAAVSHADPHAAEHEGHEAHDHADADHGGHAEAADHGDELAPDEPKTPLWLTAVGGALFLLLAIVWLVGQSAEASDVAVAPAASASATAAAAPPPPPPPPVIPTPPPPPPTVVAPAAAHPAIPTYPKRPRVKGVKP